MKSVRMRMVWNALRDFFVFNKKLIICFSVLLFLGIVTGIVSEINACGGEFERILRDDTTISCVKVFFISSLYLIIGYAVIFIGGSYRRLAFLSVIPFFLSGFFSGRFMCILAACYGSLGFINLFVIYLPFFAAQFFCMTFACCAAFGPCRRVCGSGTGKCKNLAPSLIVALKWFGINVAVDFVVFFIFGIFVDVIVIL